MTTYEYLCLACEHLFEERRPMMVGPIVTGLACPSCGSGKVRRRFSFAAATGRTAGRGPAAMPTGGGGCCGGSCGCGN
jgi:putative FmdB family regulatory protein